MKIILKIFPKISLIILLVCLIALFIVMSIESFREIVAGGLVTAILGYLLYLIQKYSNEKTEKLQILNSLLGELNTIKYLIDSRKECYINDVLKEDHSIDNYNFPYIPITLNYFTIYDNSSSALGLINDESLVKEIISCYGDVKGLFENLIDLEYASREYTKKYFELKMSDEIDENSKNELLITMINSHYDYVLHILLKQLPVVEQCIVNNIKNIELEIENTRQNHA